MDETCKRDAWWAKISECILETAFLSKCLKFLKFISILTLPETLTLIHHNCSKFYQRNLDTSCHYFIKALFASSNCLCHKIAAFNFITQFLDTYKDINVWVEYTSFRKKSLSNMLSEKFLKIISKFQISINFWISGKGAKIGWHRKYLWNISIFE